MGELYRLPHIDSPAEAPIAYASEAGSVYVFTGRHYRPNFHLVLRRRSPDDTYLSAVVSWLPEEVKNELLERYTDAEEPGEWWDFSRNDEVEEAIQKANIQTYVLNRNEFQRLLDPDDTLLTAPREPPDAGEELETLSDTRHALSAELGAILAARWSSKDGADREYHRQSVLGTTWLAFGGFMSGFGSGIGSVASDYQNLGQEVCDAAVTLWSVTLDAIRSLAVSLDGLRELINEAYDDSAEAASTLADFIINLAEEVVRQLRQLSWESIRAWFEHIEARAVDSLERAAALAQQGVEKLRVLLRDPATLRIFADFMAGFLDSFHDDWWLDATEALGQLLGIVAVEALIELALAFATAGVGSYLNGGRLIGMYSRRAIRYLARIHDEIIQATQRTADTATDIADQLRKRADVPPKPKGSGGSGAASELPDEGVPIQQRLNDDDASVPEYAQEDPESYYYDKDAGQYKKRDTNDDADVDFEPSRAAKNARDAKLTKHYKAVDRHQAKYEREVEAAKQRGDTNDQIGSYKAKVTEAKGERAAAKYMAETHPDHEMVQGFDAGDGYDQVWAERDEAGDIKQYMIVEAKGPDAELSTGANKGDQMSQEWVENTAKEMSKKSDQQTARLGKDLRRAMRGGPPPKVKGKAVQAIEENGEVTGATSVSLPDGPEFN